MKLLEKKSVLQRGTGQALGNRRNRFRHTAHSLFVLRREKHRTQKRAVHACSKGQFCGAHFFQEVLGQVGGLLQKGAKQPVPIFDRIRVPGRSWFRSSHRRTVVEGAVGAACALWTVRGAPVNPAGAPIPSISSQRGQVLATLPCKARSTTRRAILSTTCSK